MHLAVRIGYIMLEKFSSLKTRPSLRVALSLIQDVVYYGIRQNQVEPQALFQLIDPKLDEAFLVWNLVDHPVLSKALDLRAPWVGNDEVIFVPRLFPKITRDVIMKEYSENTL